MKAHELPLKVDFLRQSKLVTAKEGSKVPRKQRYDNFNPHLRDDNSRIFLLATCQCSCPFYKKIKLYRSIIKMLCCVKALSIQWLCLLNTLWKLRGTIT